MLDITSSDNHNFDNISPTIIGREYVLIINNQRFPFETTAVVANAADHIGAGLRDKLEQLIQMILKQHILEVLLF